MQSAEAKYTQMNESDWDYLIKRSTMSWGRGCFCNKSPWLSAKTPTIPEWSHFQQKVPTVPK